ncbi:MAG: hypothetical protein AAFR64_03110 [Pseudomonadota bacterium]
MADAAAQPQVIATITPNQWSTIHLDIEVQNTGNATAFDIEIAFDPPLTNGEARHDKEVPFQRISILKPQHSLKSYLSDVGDYLSQSFRVEVSWALAPDQIERQSMSYWLNMDDYRNVSYLGSRDPAVQLAEQVKKLRDDWRQIAKGSKRMRVESFSSEDRKEERRQRDKAYGRSPSKRAKDQTETLTDLLKRQYDERRRR